MLKRDEVPFCFLISEEEYKNGFDYRKEIKRTAEYVMIKCKTPRTFVHSTRRKNVENILEKGLECRDLDGTCDFGEGVYCFPEVTRRLFVNNDDCVNIVFESKDLEYYICIDSIDSNAPISYAFFTEPIPKENITTVIDVDTYKKGQGNTSNDIGVYEMEELLYVSGLYNIDREIINKEENIFEAIPKILSSCSWEQIHFNCFSKNLKAMEFGAKEEKVKMGNILKELIIVLRMDENNEFKVFCNLKTYEMDGFNLIKDNTEYVRRDSQFTSTNLSLKPSIIKDGELFKITKAYGPESTEEIIEKDIPMLANMLKEYVILSFKLVENMFNTKIKVLDKFMETRNN